MQISVKAQIADAMRMIDDVHKRHIPFASVYAATLTAREVMAAEVQTMRRVFDRPTPYAVNALYVQPATKSEPVATVEFKEFAGKGVPAKRFLNPNIHGGVRSHKSHERMLGGLLNSSYMVPSKLVEKDTYGGVPGAFFKKIVSQLKVSSDPTQNASGSRRSKGKRKFEAYFVHPKRKMILRRHSPYTEIVTDENGNTRTRKKWHIEPALIAVRAPHYQKIFPFYEVAQATVEREFPRQFVVALERAISTSNYKGKWK